MTRPTTTTSDSVPNPGLLTKWRPQDQHRDTHHNYDFPEAHTGRFGDALMQHIPSIQTEIGHDEHGEADTPENQAPVQQSHPA